jgi:hypothetical protein
VFKNINNHHVLLTEISFCVLFVLSVTVKRAFDLLEGGMDSVVALPQVSIMSIGTRMAYPSGNASILSAKMFSFLLLMFTAYYKRHRRRDGRTASQ